jgi:hypothetical protein
LVLTYYSLFLLLHRAFWKFTDYHTPTNALLNYVEIKCQLDATDEIFIADIIACSTCFGHLYAHHQEL